jgi:excisionase family DNA binding protein
MSHTETTGYEPVRIAPVLTVNQAASVLGIGRVTVYRLLRAGDLDAVRVGKRLRFRPEDLEEYLERNRESAAP